MNERILKWLYDIKDAIIEIESYFEGSKMNFNDYKSNTILIRAVERDLEIIGEAVNRIIRYNDNFPIHHAKRIVGLRNQIIHAYDSISDENIWAIIIKYIPLLKSEVNSLIDQDEKMNE
jgi:uncharacterized protein with HEPN domain